MALMLVAATPAEERAEALSGAWTVNLRLNLDDQSYSQPMVLTVGNDGSVGGSFYNSEILAGKAGTAQGRTCVAFRTTDGSGYYHTSACLVDGNMIGQTWSEGRSFVLPWTAKRPVTGD
ncbi:hypothetical protein [Altererythrobacter epoxidivorans]|nr:hypothetical protein [Altererythrobacter epoxidivorans]